MNKQLVFARWKHSTRYGHRPHLPRAAGFCVLAGSGFHHPHSEWALVETSSRATLAHVVAVPRALASLIRDGRGYPPALAIAFQQFDRFGAPTWQPDEIAAQLQRLIETQLRAQASSAFALVESVKEDLGYLGRGEFVWALGIGRSPRTRRLVVQWVSSDLQIYTNRRSDFRVPRHVARRLGPWRLPRPSLPPPPVRRG